MKRILAVVICLAFLSIATTCDAGDRIFVWNANAPADNIVKYTLKCGPVAGGPYTITTDVIAPLVTVTKTFAPGTVYCIVTATNTEAESGPSNEVSTVVLPVPGNPQTLKVNR